MSHSDSADEKQIWGALFGVSSFLYRVTERAPERDPLRWHLQDIAVRLLRETSATLFDEDKRDAARSQRVLRELAATTELLRERAWASPTMLQTLSKHTWHLRDLIERTAEKPAPQKMKGVAPAASQAPVPPQRIKKEGTQKTTRRQDRIVDILGEVDGNVAPASFFAEAFPGVTARTIRRDLQALVERGVVEQEGSGRGAQYRLSGEQALRTQ